MGVQNRSTPFLFSSASRCCASSNHRGQLGTEKYKSTYMRPKEGFEPAPQVDWHPIQSVYHATLPTFYNSLDNLVAVFSWVYLELGFMGSIFFTLYTYIS